LLLTLLFLAVTAGANGQSSREIAVPWFSQLEPWGDKPLGDSDILDIARNGCALTACAMVLKYYGVDTDPVKLNEWLLKHGGFDKGYDDKSGEYLGLVRVIWDVIADGHRSIDFFRRYDFPHLPADLYLIRGYLDAGIPVIVEVLRPGNIQHFVVLTGYEGDDFLIRDPLNENTRLLSEGYNISDQWGSGAARNIFSVRIFVPRNQR
ncbi:MAG: C39 family peptidase, partial [Spirochaetales bacterium]|nr:C39 family peptidase [Spirochaetales bacterium]